MSNPCDCWTPSGIFDINGTEYCDKCGAKKKRNRKKEAEESIAPKESCGEAAARETMEKCWKMREKQRIVDSRNNTCQRTDCAWHSPKHDQNCFRDPGDCRFIER